MFDSDKELFLMKSNDEKNFQILAENTRRAMEKQEIPDNNSPIDNLIGEIDPEVFKCHDCHEWLPLSELSPGYKEPHCRKCHPEAGPYQTFALPLMRRYFPKTIAQDLVSVVPMDKPQVVRSFLRDTFKRIGSKNENCENIQS